MSLTMLYACEDYGVVDNPKYGGGPELGKTTMPISGYMPLEKCERCILGNGYKTQLPWAPTWFIFFHTGKYKEGYQRGRWLENSLFICPNNRT